MSKPHQRWRHPAPQKCLRQAAVSLVDIKRLFVPPRKLSRENPFVSRRHCQSSTRQLFAFVLHMHAVITTISALDRAPGPHGWCQLPPPVPPEPLPPLSRAAAPSCTPAAAHHKTLVEHLEDEDETAVYALLMPAEYTMKEGAQLWPGVRLGKFLGAGVQVGAGPQPQTSPDGGLHLQGHVTPAALVFRRPACLCCPLPPGQGVPAGAR